MLMALGDCLMSKGNGLETCPSGNQEYNALFGQTRAIPAVGLVAAELLFLDLAVTVNLTLKGQFA